MTGALWPIKTGTNLLPLVQQCCLINSLKEYSAFSRELAITGSEFLHSNLDPLMFSTVRLLTLEAPTLTLPLGRTYEEYV